MCDVAMQTPLPACIASSFAGSMLCASLGEDVQMSAHKLRGLLKGH